jgi:hypothetical protein
MNKSDLIKALPEGLRNEPDPAWMDTLYPQIYDSRREESVEAGVLTTKCRNYPNHYFITKVAQIRVC